MMLLEMLLKSVTQGFSVKNPIFTAQFGIKSLIFLALVFHWIGSPSSISETICFVQF